MGLGHWHVPIILHICLINNTENDCSNKIAAKHSLTTYNLPDQAHVVEGRQKNECDIFYFSALYDHTVTDTTTGSGQFFS